jgi:hypothetical protein
LSGQFVTRIPPELHRQVNLAARRSGKSLNAWVVEQLQTAVAGVKSIAPAKVTGNEETVSKVVGKKKDATSSATRTRVQAPKSV